MSRTIDADDEEIWRPIPNFKFYEVSNLGNVRSWKFGDSRDVSIGGRAEKPRLLTASRIIGRPYLRVGLTNDEGKPLSKRVHRLVLEAFVGSCPDGMEGCHNDGNAQNNRLDNLRWDTKESNVLDIVKHGNMLHGERHPRSRLTDKQTEEIRDAIAKGKHGINRALAKKYGVSDSCISTIKKGVVRRGLWLDK